MRADFQTAKLTHFAHIGKKKLLKFSIEVFNWSEVRVIERAIKKACRSVGDTDCMPVWNMI